MEDKINLLNEGFAPVDQGEKELFVVDGAGTVEVTQHDSEVVEILDPAELFSKQANGLEEFDSHEPDLGEALHEDLGQDPPLSSVEDENAFSPEALFTAEGESSTDDSLMDSDEFTVLPEENLGPDVSNASPAPEEVALDLGSGATIDESQAEGETTEAFFGGATSAREYLTQGGLISDLAMPLTLQPSNQGQSLNQGSEASNQNRQSFNSAQGHQPQAMSAEKVTVPLSAALGAGAIKGLGGLANIGVKGVAGLGRMLGNGGREISNKIGDYNITKHQAIFNSAMSDVERLTLKFSELGLSEVLAQGEPEERTALANQFLISPENKELFKTFLEATNRLEISSKRFARKALETNMDVDEVMEMSASKISDYTEKNKMLLESLEHNNKSLLNRFDKITNSLFEIIKDAMIRLARWVQGNTANVEQETRAMPGPQLG